MKRGLPPSLLSRALVAALLIPLLPVLGQAGPQQDNFAAPSVVQASTPCPTCNQPQGPSPLGQLQKSNVTSIFDLFGGSRVNFQYPGFQNPNQGPVAPVMGWNDLDQYYPVADLPPEPKFITSYYDSSKGGLLNTASAPWNLYLPHSPIELKDGTKVWNGTAQWAYASALEQLGTPMWEQSAIVSPLPQQFIGPVRKVTGY